MNKRNLLTGGVAIAAGLAGAGWAWWRLQPHDMADGAVDALWAEQWLNPQGQPVQMQAFRGSPLLVNFWATWCPPCVKELPMLNAFYREQRARGWQVLGLAVDQVAPVKQFLQRMPLDFPVAMAGLAGVDLSKQLGNTGGGLPFTIVLDRRGAVAHRKVGQVSEDDLRAWSAAG
jgi:thiol-disulfide isomerase/thioredoxin